MRKALAVLLIVLCGCARNYWVRTLYTAQIDADSSQPSTVECSLAAPPYGYTVGYEKTASSGRKWSREENRHLQLRVTNRSEGIVTVDWDHSAIVLDKLSYAVALFERPKNSPDIEAIKKPPVPVLAPNSSIAVLVLPEQQRPSDERFSEGARGAIPPTSFLPTSVKEVPPIRVVLALTGWSAPYVDCAFKARLVSTQITRSTENPWPANGEGCIPDLGCAEGFRCVRNLCLAPGKQPPPRAKFGAACLSDDHCESGLGCQSSMCLGTRR
jgi:hypothetical protein